jgi:ATP-dependent protease HslVU (ClpYQ) peptidase subunit
MTVCIAARCGGAIVAAADSMLTAGDVQFEPPSGLKIQHFSNLAFIMTAGDAALSAELVQESGQQIRNAIQQNASHVWLIKEIVDLYLEKYNEARIKRSEVQILAPLNLNRLTFISQQNSLQPQLVSDLSKELINFQMPSMACIIAGIDTTGSHIYVVRDDQYTCADSIGFAAIGIGARHAQSQLMLAGQSYNSSLADTVLSVYVAKRRSEIAPGVGEVTEMVSVAPGNPLSSLNEGVMDKLDVEYRKIVAAENDAFTAGRREMSAYVEELARQASKQGTGGVPQESPGPEGS